LKKTLQHRVLELLRDNPGITLKDLASTIGIDPSKLKALIYKLRSLGYIEKAGKGYILTQRGESFLHYLNRVSKVESRDEGISLNEGSHAPTEVPVEEARAQNTVRIDIEPHVEHAEASSKVRTSEDIMVIIENMMNKIRELDRRLNRLEEQLRNIEKALTSHQKRSEPVSIEPPVMLYSEALSKYGSLVEKMLGENKILKIGSLIVDSGFYVNFKSKFPIRVVDVEKLNQHERQLLEEMRREALVVLHAGKEYRLIE
jgi:DNA-binding Lrp family transcriptional regulator